MKEKLIGIIVFISVILYVGINTYIIDRQMKEVYDNLSGINLSSKDARETAEECFSDFEKKEKYLSLTVNHDDLTVIEECFVEMIGYLEIGDSDNARVVKNRLTHSIEHLRRLSTFTIDAII